jgi:hypothetical protein
MAGAHILQDRISTTKTFFAENGHFARRRHQTSALPARLPDKRADANIEAR